MHEDGIAEFGDHIRPVAPRCGQAGRKCGSFEAPIVSTMICLSYFFATNTRDVQIPYKRCVVNDDKSSFFFYFEARHTRCRSCTTETSIYHCAQRGHIHAPSYTTIDCNIALHDMFFRPMITTVFVWFPRHHLRQRHRRAVR